MKRRELLVNTSAALGLLGSSGLQALGEASDGEGLFLSAATVEDNKTVRRHQLRAFELKDGAVRPRYSVDLPDRAHHIALARGQRLFVAVARRPGSWFVVGDLDSGEVLQHVNLPAGRHFQGHGIFAADDSEFWAVENAYEAQGDNGRVSRWRVDRRTEPVLREEHLYETGGTGAHELHLMPDGETLVIANGGILTHPDRGRDKLNLDTMQPSLVYLDRPSGELLERVTLADKWHQNSIRHLDVGPDGLVAVGMQYQGAPFDEVPLVFLHRRGEVPRFPEIDAATQRRMEHYCGSVRFDAGGRFVCVSCPRGNLLTFWDVQAQSLSGTLVARDACGVSACREGFLYTSGTGVVSLYDPVSGDARAMADERAERILWDNHLSAVEVS